ncbi:ABC transporter ATP-binding protein/permease [Pseudothauera rhizosphaerae]|uniref:ABC transporter ATP-binding protein/permease n=1 Tax=Pseudothauera rhizosphaerae TaxID=2565932 RepID=A0A4S4ADV7_9RHOO|nr:ABC transporter ATP-binding protein/permease [Pseudothauera rhizosphaerae]THF57292.1 ABC transporter ATP-binding protein/permease [Pseudothauera rhizosphaerae]
MEPERPSRTLGAGWQFAGLFRDYWNGSRKWTVRGAVLLLILLTVAQVGLAIWVSYWHRDLFDALEDRALGELLHLTLVFVLIFVLTMGVTALHLHVKRWVQLDWRQWLTTLVLDRWMSQARHYRLQFAAGEHDNPDGRIAEDIRIATEAAVGLAHSLLYSVLILGSFIDILLAVSGSAALPGTDVVVPGYMVLMAFVYAGAGTGLGLLLGRPLIRSTNRLQTVEANLRFGLARARAHSESIALMHGEGFERRSARRLFDDVGRGWNRQTVAYLGIVSFSTGYGTLLPVFPILIAAPQYIAGVMTLGLLMQAAQAFQRLTSALSWPVDNLGELARCRASIDRIVSLYDDMLQLERPDQEGAAAAEHIQVSHARHPDLQIRGLCLTTPTGQRLLDGFDIHVRRGERILITGDPAVTVALFKAVAGLWPWGKGEIELPEGRDVMFLPQHPFLPEGTLRAALCYPHDAGQYGDAELQRALECAGIVWLAPRLDDSDDWGRALPLRAQQHLGVARLVLQQPGWVFIDEATSAFDGQDEMDTMEMLHHELPSTTLLNISLHNGVLRFYDRKLVLKRQRPARIQSFRTERPSLLPEA